jgi:hypothetical protein
LLAGFFACDFLARFVVVVCPTTIFLSSITCSGYRLTLTPIVLGPFVVFVLCVFVQDAEGIEA